MPLRDEREPILTPTRTSDVGRRGLASHVPPPVPALWCIAHGGQSPVASAWTWLPRQTEPGRRFRNAPRPFFVDKEVSEEDFYRGITGRSPRLVLTSSFESK